MEDLRVSVLDESDYFVSSLSSTKFCIIECEIYLFVSNNKLIHKWWNE